MNSQIKYELVMRKYNILKNKNNLINKEYRINKKKKIILSFYILKSKYSNR